MSNYIPLFYMDVITYQCPNPNFHWPITYSIKRIPKEQSEAIPSLTKMVTRNITKISQITPTPTPPPHPTHTHSTHTNGQFYEPFIFLLSQTSGWTKSRLARGLRRYNVMWSLCMGTQNTSLNSPCKHTQKKWLESALHVCWDFSVNLIRVTSEFIVSIYYAHTHTHTQCITFRQQALKTEENILPTLLFSVNEFLNPLFEHNEAPSFFVYNILIYILNWICFKASDLSIVNISLDDAENATTPLSHYLDQ